MKTKIYKRINNSLITDCKEINKGTAEFVGDMLTKDMVCFDNQVINGNKVWLVGVIKGTHQHTNIKLNIAV